MATRTRARSAAPAHPSIKPVGTGSKLNIIVYGFPGVGKTVLLGSSPGKVLVIRPPIDHTLPLRGKKNIEEWEVKNWDEMMEAQTYLRDNQGAGYDWVWLDSISLFQDAGLDDIWETVITEKPARARYGLDKAEYGINMFRLGGWVRHMVGPGYFNFGITAHPAEMVHPEDDEALDILMPYVQGKNMATKICGYMNVVAYYRVVRKDGKERRAMSFRLTDKWYGKDQSGRLPRTLYDPTIPKITAAIGSEEE